MGLDYVDVFYSHRPDPETPLEETMGALDQIVRSGKALYVGISNYSPERPQVFKDLARFRYALSSPPASIQYVRSHIEEGLLGVLTEEGIGCIVFSPLAQVFPPSDI